MNTFYIVVRHMDTGIFQPLYYHTENNTLSESDLIEIEDLHSIDVGGIKEVKTQIISWQQLEMYN